MLKTKKPFLNYYDILGVDTTASISEISSAKLALNTLWNPDTGKISQAIKSAKNLEELLPEQQVQSLREKEVKTFKTAMDKSLLGTFFTSKDMQEYVNNITKKRLEEQRSALLLKINNFHQQITMAHDFLTDNKTQTQSSKDSNIKAEEWNDLCEIYEKHNLLGTVKSNGFHNN